MLKFIRNSFQLKYVHYANSAVSSGETAMINTRHHILMNVDMHVERTVLPATVGLGRPNY